jgi:hypothetical protein
MKMKIVLLIMGIALSVNASAQKNEGLNKGNAIFYPPKLVNIKNFEQDVICKGDLRWLYDTIKKEDAMFLYRYFFTVKKNGKIKSRLVDPNNGPFVSKLNQYIRKTFNKYSWEAGYLKESPFSRSNIYMELRIFFRANLEEIIDIELVAVEPHAETAIFSRKISYKELISYYSQPNCKCCEMK